MGAERRSFGPSGGSASGLCAPAHGLDGDLVRPGGVVGLPCPGVAVAVVRAGGPGVFVVAVGVTVGVVGVVGPVGVGVCVEVGVGVVGSGVLDSSASGVAAVGVGFTFGRCSDCALSFPGNGMNWLSGAGPPSTLLASNTR
ncbi:hypothetical protein EV643_104147 [Kribbella sp. VKM Ac-2527]|uniref:Uncharacterized protein n=1 Tax=Kribbella caucasensis TaxID=2512215 RepID=A0A4R6KI11_9ACTN|nr:hypothetical protein EV643_104147 [Kribbella sp. VKM Ac-2527]